MAIKIAPPNPNRPILNSDGSMTDSFRLWTQSITLRSLIIGEGSPEGAVEALQGAEYMDSTGNTGSIKYIKKHGDILGDTTKGWVLI